MAAIYLHDVNVISGDSQTNRHRKWKKSQDQLAERFASGWLVKTNI